MICYVSWRFWSILKFFKYGILKFLSFSPQIIIKNSNFGWHLFSVHKWHCIPAGTGYSGNPNTQGHRDNPHTLSFVAWTLLSSNWKLNLRKPGESRTQKIREKIYAREGRKRRTCQGQVAIVPANPSEQQESRGKSRVGKGDPFHPLLGSSCVLCSLKCAKSLN